MNICCWNCQGMLYYIADRRAPTSVRSEIDDDIRYSLPCDCILKRFAAQVLNVTAPFSYCYCYCTTAVNKCAVTAASHGSTFVDLALRSTRQPGPYIFWGPFTHTLSCHSLISTLWALVSATAPSVRSPVKASAILNESIIVVTALKFSPVSNMLIKYIVLADASCMSVLMPVLD